MTQSDTAPPSIWQTWKPYAAIAVGIVGVLWWYNSQSSIADLKDGSYACQAVYVNESGKYELLIDAVGNGFAGQATVRGGKVVEMSGDASFSSTELGSVTIRKSGSSHFHATDDPAVHNYNAVACDLAG